MSYPIQDEPVYRGVVGLDIEGFSRSEWTDPIRRRLRDRLHRLIDDALADAGIALAATARTDTGDGMWVLVRAQVSTTRLLHPVATSLAAALADGNRQAPVAHRLRCRMVVHAGDLIQDAHGHTGASWNLASRLLDAEATRAALASSPRAAMVLVVSDQVYDGVIRHGYPGVDPAMWQPIRIHAKETSTRAWVHLPGMAIQPALPVVLVAPRVGPASLPIPRELPCRVADFTGRRDELATLRVLLLAGVDGEAARSGGTPEHEPAAELARPVVISSIDGMGGIGKSALAIEAGHQLADAFPDGQLYVNLHGATPGQATLTPLEALGRLLRSLGLDPAQIPTEVEEAAGRFRSLAADRRLLVVLDDAVSARQVRPLLPANPKCGVIVTSRRVLATLPGGHALHLDVLPHGHAVELLGQIAGHQRVAAEPQAAAEVVRLCGLLPLAIRIAGARLAARPAWPVTALAERLADATRCLAELEVGELAVRASFDVSLNALQDSPDPVDQEAVVVFGLLSLPDGADLSLVAAARLLDRGEPTTETLLERLVDAQLMESSRPGRYQFHDLLRLYAQQYPETRLPRPERTAALARLLRFYTATTWQTAARLRPGDAHPATVDSRWARDGLPFPDTQAALAWLETERGNLMAAVVQAASLAPALPATFTHQLARALYPFFRVRCYWQDGLQANQTAMHLAQRTRDKSRQADASNDLGSFYRLQGRYEEAIACHQQALKTFREQGDRWAHAYTLDCLGLVYERQGRYAEAIACHLQSLRVFEELGDRWGPYANSLTYLGLVYERQGRYAEAITCHQQSLGIFQQLGDRWAYAYLLGCLGLACEGQGRYEKAIAYQQHSLAIRKDLGDRHGQAYSLGCLGLVYQRQGRHDEAIGALQESLAIRRELSDRHGEAEALRDLGDTLLAVGSVGDAEAAWQEAVAICEALHVPGADELHGRLAALMSAPSGPTGGGVPSQPHPPRTPGEPTLVGRISSLRLFAGLLHDWRPGPKA